MGDCARLPEATDACHIVRPIRSRDSAYNACVPKMGKTKLDAVYEPDLHHFLFQFGLLDAFRNQELLCLHCGVTISLENLYGFVAVGDAAVAPICNRSSCVEAAYGRTQTHEEVHGGPDAD